MTTDPRPFAPRLALLLLSALAIALPAGSTAAWAASVPAPRDAPYAGTVQLEVDATDLEHRVFDVREVIPVRPGPLTLFYPRWLPGNHAPTGPIEQLAGLTIRALAAPAGAPGQRIEWRRDPVDMHAFHLDVPRDVGALELRFQFISPLAAEQGRRVVTPDLLGLQWEKTLLYPAGHLARQIRVQPTLRLPAGWQFASALDGATRDGDVLHFAATSLETLVDSPLFAGRYFKRFELDPGAAAPAWLDVFADRPSQLEAKPEQVEAHARLVREATTLFGARHYRHYDLLLALSDQFSGIGLEHLQSSENGVGGDYFTEWATARSDRDLLPHEMTHSWIGKFRRPADLWTPNYNEPMRNSGLWVYEGMTEFWGLVLAARSGLWSEAYTRDALAWIAATFADQRPGREWRGLRDTTNQPIMAYKRALAYQSWQRGTDYYQEGLLLWLDADTRLRELTGERRSLDDFAAAFAGMQDGQPGPLNFTFDEVVGRLNDIAPQDWRGLLGARLDGHDAASMDPVAGLVRAGWKLVYDTQPNEYLRDLERSAKQVNLLASPGASFARDDGRVAQVVWGSPAFRAGLAPGMTLLAVNGRQFSGDVLKEALTAAVGDTAPIELLVKNADRYQVLKLDEHRGLRVPRLVRIEGTVDRLSALLKPRAAARP
jgi:predicted metalloprotease with PDZ domain